MHPSLGLASAGKTRALTISTDLPIYEALTGALRGQPALRVSHPQDTELQELIEHTFNAIPVVLLDDDMIS